MTPFKLAEDSLALLAQAAQGIETDTPQAHVD